MALRVERLIQLDAEHLDDTFVTVLQDQLKSGIFRHFKPAWATSAELGLALRAVIFWFSIGSDTPSPGTSLMGLRYRNERAAKSSRSMFSLSLVQKFGLGFGLVLLPYISERLESVSGEDQALGGPSWKTWIVMLFRRAEKIYKMLCAMHLVAFILLDNKYRSLLELLVGARLVPADRHAARTGMPFDFLNQQLVFNGLAEFTRWAVSRLPRVQSVLQTMWRSVLHQIQPSARAAPVEISPSEANECSVCHASPPLIGFAGQCGHVGCYVCLSIALMEDPHASCPRCGVALGKIQRYEPWHNS